MFCVNYKVLMVKGSDGVICFLTILRLASLFGKHAMKHNVTHFCLELQHIVVCVCVCECVCVCVCEGVCVCVCVCECVCVCVCVCECDGVCV